MSSLSPLLTLLLCSDAAYNSYFVANQTIWETTMSSEYDNNPSGWVQVSTISLRDSTQCDQSLDYSTTCWEVCVDANMYRVDSTLGYIDLELSFTLEPASMYSWREQCQLQINTNNVTNENDWKAIFTTKDDGKAILSTLMLPTETWNIPKLGVRVYPNAVAGKTNAGDNYAGGCCLVSFMKLSGNYLITSDPSAFPTKLPSQNPSTTPSDHPTESPTLNSAIESTVNPIINFTSTSDTVTETPISTPLSNEEGSVINGMNNTQNGIMNDKNEISDIAFVDMITNGSILLIIVAAFACGCCLNLFMMWIYCTKCSNNGKTELEIVEMKSIDSISPHTDTMSDTKKMGETDKEIITEKETMDTTAMNLIKYDVFTDNGLSMQNTQQQHVDDDEEMYFTNRQVTNGAEANQEMDDITPN